MFPCDADVIEWACEPVSRKEEVVVAIAIDDAGAFDNQEVVNFIGSHQGVTDAALRYENFMPWTKENFSL